jgi:serine O-acetyltransferase
MARAHQYATDDEVRLVAEQVWAHCQAEATEHLLSSTVSRVFGERDILAHSSYADALGSLLARKLHAAVAGPSHAGTLAGTREELEALRASMTETLSTPATLRAIIADLAVGATTDPAVELLLQPAFIHKGPLAVATHRCAHALWQRKDRAGALLLHSAASQTWGVDIHPAAQLGDGVYIDHGTGVVIGATAVVGSNVQFMHSVTLGATGTSAPGTKRHPTIGSHVSLGCGATVLGNITIGTSAVVAAQAVVTRNVPPGNPKPVAAA